MRAAAASLLCAAALTAALLPTGFDDRHEAAGDAGAAPLRLEIRWHNGQVVINGHVKDEGLQQRLFAAAQARVGGDAEQVLDLAIVKPDAVVPADVDAVCELIGRGAEGWVLRWTERGATLYGNAGSQTQLRAADRALREGFAPASDSFLVTNALVVR